MKAKEESWKMRLPSGTVRTVRPVVLGILSSVLLVGCSTEKPAGLILAPRPVPTTIALAPGVIAITSPGTPARFDFDAPRGRIESAGEGATDAARAIMNTPPLAMSLSADIHEALGVVEFAAMPFAAAYGALTAAHRVLPPDGLAETEADLIQAMRAAADQRHFEQFVTESAHNQDRWSVISLPANGQQKPRVSAVLETTVERVQLARLDKSDSSYVLRLKVRARLLRPSDRAVLSDRAFEYQSGKALFIDWASWHGLESVATTGYRSLADQISAEMLPSASDEPLLLGAGYRNESHSPEASIVRAEWRPEASIQIQPVGLFAVQNDSVEVYATHPIPDLRIQRPMTRHEAVEESVEQNGWDLDGMQDDRNSVVQALAQVAIVPTGLWRQAVAIFRGRSERKLAAEEAAVHAAAQGVKPGLVLAHQVALCLAANTTETVSFASDISPDRGLADPQVMLCSAPAARTQRIQNSAQVLPAAPPGTALEIRVLKAELAGQPGVNPPLALCFEAKATLYRVADGQPLYSCPVFYRTQQRRFKQWAQANAELLRQDLNRAYAEMANALTHQMVVRGIVPPARQSGTTLATN